MKFFMDTADVEAIRKAVELGMCDGVTTNPTLIMKSGKAQKHVIQEIAKLVKGPISVEGVSETYEGMMKEAIEFAKWAPNVVIKLPMSKNGLRAVRSLCEKDIKTNVTLVFSTSQAILAAKAGATYVSPFIGRLDDISEDGIGLIREIIAVYENHGYETEIIVASVRHPRHVVDSALIGAHVVTIPAEVFEKMWKHPLTDKGIAQFKEDYNKSLAAQK